MLKVKIYEYNSPCGKLWLAAKRGKLCLCEWAGSKNVKDNLSRLSKALDVEFILPEPPAPGEEAKPDKPTSKVLLSAMKQLGQYFSGRRKYFSIPYQTAGTPFQDAVWKSLLDIPYGKNVSYADIASAAGYPKAVRAAANACGDNAISIIIPCHRVIGSDTGLTGYGGGLGAKRFLLDLESNLQRLPFKAPSAKKSSAKKKSTKKASKKTARKKPETKKKSISQKQD